METASEFVTSFGPVTSQIETQRFRPRDAIGVSATEGRSRISAMHAIPRVLDALRLDPDAVLADVGVETRIFEDLDNLIRDDVVGRMLMHCAARSGRDDFALQVGAHAGLASLGLVGALAATAPDVGTALRTLSRFLGLNDGGAIVSISTGGAHASFGYAIYESGLRGTRDIYLMVSAVLFNVIRDLCGPTWVPTLVQLPCHRPRDLQSLRAYFRAPLRFDSHRLSLAFEHHWLDRLLPTADRALHAALLANAEAFEAQAPAPLPSQVRRLMRRLLIDGKGSIEIVAKTFSMHRRTLDRRLDSCGASFREVADGVRFEVARQLLGDTQMSVSEIAAALHYCDTSAFTHAFRRWSGDTPRQWRLARGVSAA